MKHKVVSINFETKIKR